MEIQDNFKAVSKIIMIIMHFLIVLIVRIILIIIIIMIILNIIMIIGNLWEDAAVPDVFKVVGDVVHHLLSCDQLSSSL